MAFEITGKIHDIFPTEQIKETFKKREFVLSYDENGYEQLIKFQCIQDRCSIMDSYKPGDEVKIAFNIKGRSYTNRDGKLMYFTNLEAWRIEGAGSGPSQPADTAFPEDSFSQAPPPDDDDLPF
ncbi:MAG: DUF3127 domain-containing protein [Bacteroidia bacterium]